MRALLEAFLPTILARRMTLTPSLSTDVERGNPNLHFVGGGADKVQLGEEVSGTAHGIDNEVAIRLGHEINVEIVAIEA